MKYNEVKLNELETKSYDVRRRYGVDYVTEFTYISDNSLNLEEFEKVLEGKGAYGTLTFIKKLMNFGNGKKLYKHVCKAVMY